VNSDPPASPAIGAFERNVGDEANASGISWSAVVGGALVTAAVALILLALGVGFGLSMDAGSADVAALGALVAARTGLSAHAGKESLRS